MRDKDGLLESPTAAATAVLQQSTTTIVRSFTSTAAITQNKIDSMKQAVASMVHAMQPQRPSVFSWFSTNLWSRIPTWAKVLIGFLLTVPPFGIGIIAGIPIPPVLSVLLGSYYLAAAIVLSDHQIINHNRQQVLSTCTGRLVDTLADAIASLDTLADQLALVTDTLRQENDNLSVAINSLTNERQALTAEASALTTQEQGIRHTTEQLSHTQQALTARLHADHATQQANASRLEAVLTENKRVQEAINGTLAQLESEQAALSTQLASVSQNAAAMRSITSNSATQLFKNNQSLCSNILQCIAASATAMSSSIEEAASKTTSVQDILRRAKTTLQRTNKEARAANAQQRDLIDTLEAAAAAPATRHSRRQNRRPHGPTTGDYRMALSFFSSTKEPQQVAAPVPLTPTQMH